MSKRSDYWAEYIAWCVALGMVTLLVMGVIGLVMQ